MTCNVRWGKTAGCTAGKKLLEYPHPRILNDFEALTAWFEIVVSFPNVYRALFCVYVLCTITSFSTPCRFCSSTFSRNGPILDSHICRLCWLSVGWGGGATKSKTENDRAWAPFVLRQDQISISHRVWNTFAWLWLRLQIRYFHPSWTLRGVGSFYWLVNCPAVDEIFRDWPIKTLPNQNQQYQVNSLPSFHERIVMSQAI